MAEPTPETEDDRKADYLVRVSGSKGDPELERLAWALCPFIRDDFDYPRLPLPKCEQCKWGEETGGGTRGCRHHAQQVALAAREHLGDAARQQGYREGWRDFGDSYKQRVWIAKEPFHIADAIELVNRHHQSEYGNGIRALTPEDVMETPT